MDKKHIILGQVDLKHFRCFSEARFTFESPITWISGANGTGKTSLFEALYYACYLRSFRAMHAREMIYMNEDSFFIKLSLLNTLFDETTHQLQAGFSCKKRIIKIDAKPVASHKELLRYYRVITITEDDLELIQEGPQRRRTFLDQTIALQDTEYGILLKELKNAVEHKQALLYLPYIDTEMYQIWTDQIREKSDRIQTMRKTLLFEMEQRIKELLCICEEPEIMVSYTYDDKTATVSDQLLFEKEKRYKRVLQGAHLDDIKIHFQGKSSRLYASRGQQKFLLFLMKIYQIECITRIRGTVLTLIDDFITDLDPHRYKKIITLLEHLQTQIIYTSPYNRKELPATYYTPAGVSYIELPR